MIDSHPASEIVGRTYWFEYHCYEGHDSADASLWYRSHQRVTVAREEASDAPPGSTAAERAAWATPRVFAVRFPDGTAGTAFEDELLDSPAAYQRPAPPLSPDAVPAR